MQGFLRGAALASAALLPFSLAPAGAGEIPFARRVVDPEPPRDPWYKMRGDIDGDGDEDILVAGRKGPLVWYAYPSWERTEIAPGGWDGVNGETGDVDGDGDLDAVLGGIVWFRNPRIGGGASWTKESVASFKAHDIELADLDGDGALDVVARDQSAFGDSGNEIRIYLQSSADDGDGEAARAWSERVIPCPHGEGLKAGDIDADGDPDIAIAGRWYENDGRPAEGEWAERVYTASYEEPDAKVETADFDGDGHVDIVLAPAEKAGGTSRIAWFRAPGDPRRGAWKEQVVADGVETVYHSLATGDLDGDGDADIATAEMHQGRDPDKVLVYRNQGGGMAWDEQVLSTRGSHDIFVADIGGDGDLDVVGANWSGGFQPLELWENLSAD